MNGADLPRAVLPLASKIELPLADGGEPGAPPEAPHPEAAATLAAAIRDFIHDAYLPAEPIDALTLDLDLIENGILDSLAVVEVADFLEDQSGRAVETHELTRSNIGTIEAMAAFVLRRRAAAGR
jgi:acyl carrier protein